jgi:TldD protein
VDIRKELAGRVVETARLRGASYADARVVELRLRNFSTKNGKVGTLVESETLGIGVHAIAQGAWGFASTDDLSPEGVERCATRAVEIARSSALARREGVALAPEPPHVDTWQGPFLKDPFRIPLDPQVDLLLEAGREMRRVKGVTLAEGGLSFRRQDQIFVSSEGSSIYQLTMQIGAGIVATCFSGGDIQKRSYPNSFGGYELTEVMNLGSPPNAWAKNRWRSTAQRNAPRARGPSFWMARSSACKFTNPSGIRSSWIACSVAKRIMLE